MMAAMFNGNPRATIISCYSPTNVSEETELIAFYDELSSLVHSIPKHNMLVIGGDMNAQIGKNRNCKYSLHNTSNRNGQHQTDFLIENRSTCLNANYHKREGKLWTYTSSSSSSCHAACMDIPDPLSPLLTIVHRLWQVFRATSRILT